MMNNLDSKDRQILAERLAARTALQEPVEGDYVYFQTGQLERFSYDLGGGLQTSPSGSFYLQSTGRASFSGGLNPPTPRKKLKLSTATLPGSFWFFHHGISGANRGVVFEIPCRVFLTTAKYEGFLGGSFQSPKTDELRADLQRQLHSAGVHMEQASPD